MPGAKNLVFFIIPAALFLFSCEKQENETTKHSVSTNGLIGHYTFDNTMTDKVSSTANLQSFGNFNYSDGLFSDCINFENTTSGNYLKGPGFNINETSNYSISIWFNSSKTYYTLISKGYGAYAGSYYGLELFVSQGEPSCSFGYGFMKDDIDFNKQVNDGKWHNLILIHDYSSSAPRLKIYIDGESFTDNSYLSIQHIKFNANLNNNTIIGPYNTTSQLKIDQLRFYDRVLSEDEVKDIYLEI